MSVQPPQPPQPGQSAQPQQPPQKDEQILGLSTTGIAGLSIDELVNNKVAITMLVNYYRQLLDNTTTLENERNTYKGYVDSYEKQKAGSRLGAVLLCGSNVLIGFGINIITGATPTSPQYRPGWLVLLGGVVMAAIGLWSSISER